MTSSADRDAALAPQNRVVLLDDLRPPEGFIFDAAVATTFTLGLNAALLPPLGFSSHSLRSNTIDPVSTMEAIRRAASSIDIFCQAGMVAVPRSAPTLLAFVEPMIHQVTAPRRGLFHPKVWCVRYRDDDARLTHRVLVLSRNITEDRTWDVSLRLDQAGTSDIALDANRGLTDLIRSLPDRTTRPMDRARAQRVRALADDLQLVEWEKPEGVSDLTFHLYDDGYPSLPPPLPELVVSPFLDDDGLTELLKVTSRAAVVSRIEALEGLSATTLKRLEAYVMDPGFVVEDDLDAYSPVEGEAAVRPEQASSLLTGLHAKFFVTYEPSRWSRRRLFMGSANATRAAFTGNTELLVELEGHRDLFGREAMLDPERGFGALVMPYTATGGQEPTAQDEEERELERHLRRVAAIHHTVTVQPPESHDGDFLLEITSEKEYRLPMGWTIELELLTLPGRTRRPEPGAPVREMLAGVKTEDVTPFLVVRLRSEHLSADSVILAELVGDPPDRLDVILAKQIDSPEKFMRFVLLLLSLGDPSMLADLTGSGGGDGSGEFAILGERGLLEMILRALAVRPEVLDDIGSLVERMRQTEVGRSQLPEGFDDLWAEVEKARGMIGGAR